MRDGDDVDICRICGRTHEVGCVCPGVALGEHTLSLRPAFVSPIYADDVRVCGATGRLSSEAVVELEEFRVHLSDHKLRTESQYPECRFCVARSRVIGVDP